MRSIKISLSRALLALFAGFCMVYAHEAGGLTDLPPAETSPRSGGGLGHQESFPRFGAYEYVEQQGLYKDITLGESLEDLGKAASSIGSSSIIALKRYAGRSSRHTIAVLTLNFGGG